MSSKLSVLIDLVHKLPEDSLDEAIDSIRKITEENEAEKPVPDCPYCKSEKTTRYGHQRGKQKYRCSECGRTYLATTNTTMAQSHYGESVWTQVIRDTVDGDSIDKTADSLGLSHSTVFNMRHKILLALENAETMDPTVLDGVCELDDTYVLESEKGKKLPAGYWRKARKHGAKAQKRGISNEYVSVCTGVGRDGKAIARTVNRATPSTENITEVFGNRVDQMSLVLCDGAKSYNVLSDECGCEVECIKNGEEERGNGNSFYNINTANNFHSFIKEAYGDYRGVATKYLNRYNALLSKTYRNKDSAATEIYNIMMSTDKNLYSSYEDVKTANLLDI
jgi:transposase-like protein